MKITNPLNSLPGIASATAPRRTNSTSGAFQTLLGERSRQASEGATLKLADSVLVLLERISRMMENGATAREMSAAHEQLAQRTGELRLAASELEPGSLKDLTAECDALSAVQLWRFEQGELV
jgi:hypothetical protein